jgi:hypothetical protein
VKKSKVTKPKIVKKSREPLIRLAITIGTRRPKEFKSFTFGLAHPPGIDLRLFMIMRNWRR